MKPNTNSYKLLLISSTLFIFSLLLNIFLFNRIKTEKSNIQKTFSNDQNKKINEDEVKIHTTSISPNPFVMKDTLMCQFVTTHWATTDLIKDEVSVTSDVAGDVRFSLEFDTKNKTVIRSANEGERIIEGKHEIIQEDINTLSTLRKTEFSEDHIDSEIVNYEHIILSKKTGFGIIYFDDINTVSNDNIHSSKGTIYFQCE